ncbi:hypothetical protein MK528_11550, partial [Streptococcus gordonii]|nr:hypothetical protein [Streptococcus gordonii]
VIEATKANNRKGILVTGELLLLWSFTVPLFPASVWKVCAQPPIVGGCDSVSPLEPAPQVALIGES